ncbi:MAG TPA: archease [Candidatus Binatia bacterium]
MKSREIEHTADLGIEVEGGDLPELFMVAGQALFGLMADRRGIRAKEKIAVAASGDGWEELLHSWLCELLAQFNLNGFIGRDCKIKKIESGRVEGEVRGEQLDLKRHHFYTEIKGVTYHDLKVWRRGQRWCARVIFDV